MQENPVAEATLQNSGVQNFKEKKMENEKSTKTNEIQQFRENFPAEFVAQPRFFSLLGNTKSALPTGWSKPENQKHLENCKGVVGFDVTGHGKATDYIFLDFDHVLNDDGTFINAAAEKFVAEILNDFGGYCERSISGAGLHMFAVPSNEYAETLKPMSGGRNASYYFSDEGGKDCSKIEIFYKTRGRYCLLTGDCYECNPKTPITRGKKADDALKNILARIVEQNGTKKFSQKDENFQKIRAEYFSDLERAKAMLEKIDVSQLTDSDWLAVMSACKNIGVPYGVVDAKNATDTERYNEEENLTRWESLTDTSFGIATLHGIAKRFGYSERDFQREKYAEQKTPEYRDDSEPEPVNEKTDSNKKSNATKLSREEKLALFSLPHTDLYNAKRLAMFHGKYFRYLTDTGKWYTYSDKKNIWVDGGKESAAILPFAHELAQTISANVEVSNETDEKLAKRWQAHKTISNAIALAKGFPSIRITEQDLNTHKNLLNCQNCVVDLQTLKTYPHDPNLLLTQCINAEYIPNCTDETVEKFFCDVLPDKEIRDFFFQFLGYCLTGEIREEKALFIHGSGGNGKSVATGTLLKLFGDYACGFPVEAVLVQPRIKDADTATPAFNKLQWRRLAVSEEIPASQKLDYAKFKILTGGDALPIRKLHQEATEIKDPTHKMIFSGNHLPELDDTHDAGILRRWIQIKFEQDFTGDKCKPNLKQTLTTPNALNALLSKLVDYSKEWYQNGLKIPEKMEHAKKSYFAANDFVAEFISEFCECGNGFSVSRKEFLKKLRAEYPRETYGKSDTALTSIAAKIDGIGYRRGGNRGSYRLFNIKLRECDSQENLDFIPPGI